ncbi:hypothetical protein KUL25_04600 [Rhodobacteraceae bacterium N5(2021)]|uniref:Uncharacterized protein n=1 Tax=Gymnodinialimonas phycosphaerae TaxID=2841589 RepID=A0A975TX34_9RHOB|nr:hypothetical protein [Gymnodinialimonas phycosphaerae]MBY4892039.1 hypothetical protein [Gymnodinialimonas phycosphaerae]
MGKTHTIAAGTRAQVFRLFSSSIPSTITFTATAPQGEVTGTIEVDRWHWFHWTHETLPLCAHNAIEKGFGDVDFLIHVTPDQDCTLTFERRGLGLGLMLAILAALVVVALAVVMIVLTVEPTPR